MLKRLFDAEQIAELGAIVQTFDLLSRCLVRELFELWKCGPKAAGVGCQWRDFHSADVCGGRWREVTQGTAIRTPL